jgi:hypothetical protein
LLDSCNIEVHTASSAAEAIDVVKSSIADVVLSDVAKAHLAKPVEPNEVLGILPVLTSLASTR